MRRSRRSCYGCVIWVTTSRTTALPSVHEKAAPKKRDRAMVDEAEVLIACPGALEPVQGSGTWYTIGYARRRGVPVRYVWPDGKVTSEPER